MREGMAAIRALRDDARYAPRNSQRRQVGAAAGHISRIKSRTRCNPFGVRTARTQRRSTDRTRFNGCASCGGCKSMMLYILRHAAAEEAASGGDDGARKLTERSKEKMQGAAAGLRAMGLKFDAILTSPLARATETAELVAGAYDNTPPPQVMPALATGIAATDAVSALRAFAKIDEVMIVGHEPELTAIA